MPRIVVAPVAAASLSRLVRTHSLPGDTLERFRRSIRPLQDFPQLGRALEDDGGLRFVLGPWRWMVVVYEHDPSSDTVNVLAVEDARSSAAATAATRP